MHAGKYADCDWLNCYKRTNRGYFLTIRD